MKIIRATTDDAIKLARTSVSADIAAGAGAVIPVPNSIGFAVNDYICVGTEGSDTAELTIVTAVGTGTITATLLLGHKQDEPIVKFRFNQRKVYGATTREGSYAELTAYGSPAAIRVDNPQGAVVEYTGNEGYVWFKSTYYNSTGALESAIADAIPFLGQDSARYCSLYAIRKQAGLTNNPFVTDGTIENYRLRAENEVKSYIMTRYQLPLARTDGTQEVPGIIENATVLLAAGYMDWQELGKEGEGVKWLGEARGILNSIKKGTQRLLGTDDAEMLFIAEGNQVQGYPDDVDLTGETTNSRQFSMGQKF